MEGDTGLNLLKGEMRGSRVGILTETIVHVAVYGLGYGGLGADLYGVLIRDGAKVVKAAYVVVMDVGDEAGSDDGEAIGIDAYGEGAPFLLMEVLKAQHLCAEVGAAVEENVFAGGCL